MPLQLRDGTQIPPEIVLQIIQQLYPKEFAAACDAVVAGIEFGRQQAAATTQAEATGHPSLTAVDDINPDTP